MSHVPNRDGVLLVDDGEERPLVVDLEVEDAMLVGEGERYRVGAVLASDCSTAQGKTVKGGEHAKFELKVIAIGDDVRTPL